VCLRNLLFELSEGINSQTLKNMIFLLRERIPKTKMVSGSCRMGSMAALSVLRKMLQRVRRRLIIFILLIFSLRWSLEVMCFCLLYFCYCFLHFFSVYCKNSTNQTTNRTQVQKMTQARYGGSYM
jgi:hypothetical protein